MNGKGIQMRCKIKLDQCVHFVSPPSKTTVDESTERRSPVASCLILLSEVRNLVSFIESVLDFFQCIIVRGHP